MGNEIKDSMQGQFVPYELSLDMKALGFSEICFAWYNYGHLNLFNEDAQLDMYAGEDYRPLVPLWQQAFDWFRDKHNIDYAIYPTYAVPQTYFCAINRKVIIDPELDSISSLISTHKLYTNYRSAQTACLEKMIEIAKNNKQ